VSSQIANSRVASRRHIWATALCRHTEVCRDARRRTGDGLETRLCIFAVRQSPGGARVARRSSLAPSKKIIMAATAALDFIFCLEREKGKTTVPIDWKRSLDGRDLEIELCMAHCLIYPVDPGLCVLRPFVITEALLYRYIRSVLSTNERLLSCYNADRVSISRRYRVSEFESILWGRVNDYCC